MSPKTRELSASLRDRFILLQKQGKIYREIGKTFILNFSAVRYVIKLY